MDHRTSVIFSSCIAVFYTLFGGLYSVAYTDVIQLFCIFIGLWMCIPFAWANEHVAPLSSMEVDWIGEINPGEYWFYIDYGLLLVFGGIPWQVNDNKTSCSIQTNPFLLFRSISKGYYLVKLPEGHKFCPTLQLLDAF